MVQPAFSRLSPFTLNILGSALVEARLRRSRTQLEDLVTPFPRVPSPDQDCSSLLLQSCTLLEGQVTSGQHHTPSGAPAIFCRRRIPLAVQGCGHGQFVSWG